MRRLQHLHTGQRISVADMDAVGTAMKLDLANGSSTLSPFIKLGAR